MNKNRSVATIEAPEFINLEPDAINPGISRCEIKVFYLGKNRNGSYIDKNTAIQMANSLPGTPIVGAYRKDIEDFGDHGHIMHIEDGEIMFSCKTMPYGFVDPQAEVWFKKFIDTDEFGNEIEREYLMTQGLLWTDQYPEAFSCIQEGKGQSMELDEKTLDGKWATDNTSGIEFFIINDAIFSKLCILGDDVEPCFEGAAVTGPEISKDFTTDKEFSHTLFAMMKELQHTLQNKGGSDMPKDIEQEEVQDVVLEMTLEDSDQESSDFACGSNDKKKNYEEDEEEYACGTGDKKKKYEEDEDEYACGSSDKKKKYADEEKKQEQEQDKTQEQVDKEEDKKKPATQNTLEEYEMMKNQIASLEEELNELRQFKLQQENLRKDALINKYHMLSNEDKADVISHKEEYSYEDIEAKLALIYVNKNVDFSTLDGKIQEVVVEEAEEDPITTFSLEESTGFVPPMVEALRQVKKNKF